MTPQWNALPEEPRMQECGVCSYPYYPYHVKTRCIDGAGKETPYLDFYSCLPSEILVRQAQCPICQSWNEY